jgi:hypothetical protein
VCGARRSVEFRVASEMFTTRSQEALVIGRKLYIAWTLDAWTNNVYQDASKLIVSPIDQTRLPRTRCSCGSRPPGGPMVGAMGMACITGKENPN